MKYIANFICCWEKVNRGYVKINHWSKLSCLFWVKGGGDMYWQPFFSQVPYFFGNKGNLIYQLLKDSWQVAHNCLPSFYWSTWPVVIIVFAKCYPSVCTPVRTPVPTFQNLVKQNKFQVKTMFTTGETVGLAEWLTIVFLLSIPPYITASVLFALGNTTS